jgi:hypothetical protein
MERLPFDATKIRHIRYCGNLSEAYQFFGLFNTVNMKGANEPAEQPLPKQ